MEQVLYPCCELTVRVELLPGDSTTLIGGVCPRHGFSVMKLANIENAQRTQIFSYSRLKKELNVLRTFLKERTRDLLRCPQHPGGERCCLPAGHEGACKWENGD